MKAVDKADFTDRERSLGIIFQHSNRTRRQSGQVRLCEPSRDCQPKP